MILKKDQKIDIEAVADSGEILSSLIIENSEGKLRVSSFKNPTSKIKCKTVDYLSDLSEDYKYKTNILNLYQSWKLLFELMPAGAKRHHINEGGLSTHTAQVIEIALSLRELRKDLLNGVVSKDDIIIAGFLHDFSKVKMYRKLIDQEEAKKNGGRPFTWDNQLRPLDPETWTFQQCMEFGIVLTPAQINAIYYAEGGFAHWVDQSPQPEWTELGVLMCCADLYSAMIIGK